MPNIKISKTKFRRGPNSQRGAITYDQGEPVYTTDTHRLFIGNGTPNTESVIGSKIHPPLVNYYSLSNTNAEVGDVVFCNNKWYQLTATNYTDINSWMDAGLRIDSSIFKYTSTNSLSVIPNSIDASYLKSSTVSNGLKIDGELLQADINTKSLEISSSKISVKTSGIDEREISTSALSSGLIGGSGSKIRLDVDPSYFYFSGNTLSLSSAPISLTFSDLDPLWFGAGLNVDELNTVISIDTDIFGDGLVYSTATNSVSTTLVDIDNNSLVKTSSGVISMSSNASLSGTNEWPQITVDQFGRVVENTSSIKSILQGDSPQGSFNVTNSLSTLFNGSPTGVYDGTGRITRFSALSSDGTTVVTLSSSGFITFEGNTTTRDGDSIPSRFAIPIYTY